MTPHLRTESDKKANNIMKKNDTEQTRENISPARRNTPARRKILNALEEYSASSFFGLGSLVMSFALK